MKSDNDRLFSSRDRKNIAEYNINAQEMQLVLSKQMVANDNDNNVG